jgi:HPt (histidine-containing phosphotransfer) domain-containing protein
MTAVDSAVTSDSAEVDDTALPARPPEDRPLEEQEVIDMLEAPLVFTPADESAVATAQPGVLDLEQVEAIRSLGKSALFEKLCALLFASAPATLQSIGQALAAGDLGAIADAAHSLKSSCANLGGRQLAAQLDRCEMAARDARDIEQARAAAVGLEQSYAALAAALVRESERPTGTS